MDFTPEQKNSLRVVIQEVFGGVATKDDFLSIKEDLKGFATKEDLKQFATKEDLKGFATKEDLKCFATKEDLQGVRNDLEQVEDRLAITMANSFQQMQEQFDRLENILNHWSPPSYVAELMDRVGKIEKYLKFKPHHQ